MGDHKAFFYAGSLRTVLTVTGTLMAPEVLHRVCYGTTQPTEFQKSLLTVRPAILQGYERHRVKGCDYPAIIPASPSNPALGASSVSVRGTYATGLTDGDMWRLDIFEGDEYKRAHVDVHPLDKVGDMDGTGDVKASETVRVQTYVYIAGRDHLEDGEWDFADFVRTKMQRWTGAEEYEGESYAISKAQINQYKYKASKTGQNALSRILANRYSWSTEVDEAVKAANEKDPTGGRGNTGAIADKLREERRRSAEAQKTRAD